jgi:hypothetical protein
LLPIHEAENESLTQKRCNKSLTSAPIFSF